GERWRQSTISYMLRNPFYKGEGAWRRRYEAKNSRGNKSKYNSPPDAVVRYEDYQVPAIVPPELWERCARLRRMNTKLAPRNSRRFYLLRGLVRCGLCGRTYTGVSQQGRWFYYQCKSHYTVGRPNCGNRRVRAAELERLVWAEIERFALEPGKVLRKIQRARAPGAPPEASAHRLEQRLAAKQRERARVITWAREGRITEGELDAQLAQLRAEVAALESERARSEGAARAASEVRSRLADAEAFFKELAGRIGELTDEQRARIVRQLVPRVLLKPRADGRVSAVATYLFAPPSITATAPLRASP
ncbi:MAG: recombinase zinc beta ribbon domain-containing protein, partial [Acidobacteria bacterium]|nr:recombinase zinc beta ribbon domain-containing protein [Acidobacteriota bacterium]MCA1643695.1 recombinase zinc beta ribbon domain-containing protein [Acidobacteriota bacterium]